MRITQSRALKVQKDKHTATVYLNAYRIVGTIHLQVGGRVSDFANWNITDGPFIPLTEVTVFNVATGERLFATEFLAVHRNQINFLTIDRQEPAPPAG
jgi:hypothetical protein